MTQSIAIFEDEGITALHLRALLTGWGYSVVAVSDTAESVEALIESAQPDLVLMDIRLKGEMDGIDAAAIIHRRFGVPVVFLSAHSDESTRRRIRRSHAYGLVVKPFDDQEVRVAVKSALHRRRIELALAPAIDGPAPTLPELGDAVMATDREGRIVYMNEPAENLTGWKDIDAFENEATDVIRLNMAVDGALIEHPVSSVLQDIERGDRPRDSILTSRSGSLRAISHRVTPVRDRSGELLGAVITMRRRQEPRPGGSAGAEDTRFDVVTGLVTPDLVTDYLGEAIARARKRQTMVAVFLADIDGFGPFLESAGPGIGEELLVATVKRMQKSIRASDSVARLHDTTFAVIQPDLEYAGGAVILGEKLVRIFREPFVVGDDEITGTASVGAALFPVDGEEPAQLLRHAEVATGQARAAGRDQLRFSNEKVSSAISEEQHLGDDLEGAIANNQLEISFQPVCDLSSRVIVGAEVRLRWKHPERGLIPASVFLAVAERHGKLPAITDWTLRQALTRGATFRHVKPDIRISMTLPGSEIRRRNLVPHLLTILEDTGMEPHHLDLELSEDVLVTQPPLTTHLNLQRLRQLGVNLTLDKFGFAYASMMTLKKYPVHRIKIDASLVAVVSYEKESQAIIKTTIDLARNCGLEIAADGVDGEGQWRWLRYHGCEIGQGEFLGGLLTGQQLFERLVDQQL